MNEVLWEGRFSKSHYNNRTRGPRPGLCVYTLLSEAAIQGSMASSMREPL